MDHRRNPSSAMGRPLVQLDPPEGSKLNLISINWCDKTTWYPQSVKVEDETFTGDVGHTIYDPDEARPWVDVMHGKLTDERTLRAEYQPVVKVDGVTKTENSPGETDNDYSINYSTGQITFNAALQAEDVVTVTYWYVTTSKWRIVPLEGKMIRVTAVELQFSTNVTMLDTIVFQAYGLVDVFAPQLMPGVPSGTKIPLGDPTVYQTLQDIINEASLSYPEIPKLGGDGWRGMKGPMQIFRWPWTDRGSTDVHSAYGMELEVCIENDVAFGGDIAINTFYAVSEDEPT